MTTALVTIGILIVVFTVVDVLSTTVSANSGAGPAAAVTARGVWRALRVDRSARLRKLSGPAVVVVTILVWNALLWLGWTLIFTADPNAVVGSHSGAPADLSSKIYYAGFVIFTLGLGDYTPAGGAWEIATAIAVFTGLFLVTLTVTWLVSVASAAVSRRSFATAVHQLGQDGPQIAQTLHSGNRSSPQLALQVQSLSSQLNQLAQQHLTYPVLHCFHAGNRTASAPVAVAALHDSVLLLGHGLRPDARPDPLSLQLLESAISQYAQRMETAPVDARADEAPEPSLRGLAATGLPTTDEADLRRALTRTSQLRHTLNKLVRSDGQHWPQHN